jgi:hypothetical protein
MITVEERVEACLQALKEEEKIPPEERFAMRVRAGIIDENGRLLHQEGDDEQIPISQMIAEQRSRR